MNAPLSMKIAQRLLVATVILNFLIIVYQDFNGRSSREPGGFAGFIGSVSCLGIQIAILYYAGALSSWRKP